MTMTLSKLTRHPDVALRALEREETIFLTHRGQVKGTINPPAPLRKRMRVQDHPMCGCDKDNPESVEDVMNRLRAPRYTF